MSDPADDVLVEQRVIAEAIAALRTAHTYWMQFNDRLDHRLGENDAGCTLCHAVAALEGRVEPLDEADL